MRIALIADVHGNLPALEAVMADLRGQRVEAIANLGDHLSGPLWAAPTAERLMNLDMVHIRGNHDRQLLAGPPGMMGPSDRAAFVELNDRHKAWLRELPLTAVLGGILLCHGTPSRDDEYLLEQPDGRGLGAAEAVAARLGATAEAWIACGHSHIPRLVTLAPDRVIVNPGSVGLPAYNAEDHDMECGSPHARYAIVDRATGEVEHRAIVYDSNAAAERAGAQGRPDWAHALRTGYALR